MEGNLNCLRFYAQYIELREELIKFVCSKYELIHEYESYELSNIIDKRSFCM